jgi:hypothetical protein
MYPPELYPSSPMGVDTADTSQLPKEKNLHGQFQYFQKTQPGSSTATPKEKNLRGQFQYFQTVFRIHEILLWIRIRGSMPLTNGSGSCYFRH